ncbi:ABC transporter permease [Chitinophaga sp. 212800010-3]|uniref:ABC transporter permease n=1 Tax=unclassified Chitinophaga TaxID=2619133 RepID=UPI002DF29C37|nr:putative ABC transport system permease protein [Chitinophaga sp. 212800010-3]
MLLFNYIKLAWRNLIKSKLYSFINIGGLAAGLCVCMLIMLYVAHEYSYDRFHKDKDRIFALYQRIKLSNDTLQIDHFKFGTARAIQHQNAAVESFLRVGGPVGETAVIENPADPASKAEATNLSFTDAGYFIFFSFPLLQGDPETALKQPFSIVISASAARRYFGNEDVIGKQLRYNSQYLFQVTGVMADAPSNSSIKADFLLSMASIPGIESLKQFAADAQGVGGMFNVYLKLDAPAHATAVAGNISRQQAADGEPGRSLLVPFTDLHTSPQFNPGFSLRYLKLFPVVAILVLLMALINYMSLSTARATVRAREIGVRKALGAGHKHIARQFYVESALYAVLAFLLALGLCFCGRNWFFNLLQLKTDLRFLFHPTVLTIYAALLLITIVVAGSYPSFVLSRYNPITVLSGKMRKSSGGASVRKVLTVAQFSMATLLIICSIVINRQLYFFRHTNTGISKANILMLPFQSSMGNHYQAYRQQVSELNGVLETGTARYPLYGGLGMWFIQEEAPRPGLALWMMDMDRPLLNMEGLQWKIPPADMTQVGMEEKIVLNEVAVERLGFTSSPVGRYVNLGGNKMEVIGVVKDFHFQSLHSAIAPLGITVQTASSALWGSKSPGCLFVKIAPEQDLPALIAQIRKIYTAYDPAGPFKYNFLDEAFEKMYTAEDRLSGLFDGFTVLTILIAGMGLLGLAAFAAEQRMKEIGVRKVLGASVLQITALLSGEYVRLIIIALAIASPVAGYLMHQWLQQFAYRIHMQPWMFVLSACIAAATALLAIGAQTLKAAVRNPVATLRVE